MTTRASTANGTAALYSGDRRRTANGFGAAAIKIDPQPAADPAHEAPAINTNTSVFRPAEWDWLSDQLSLSPRETDVVRHIFRGHSEARAAFLMGLSPDTVHTYVRRAYAKLGVHDQKELILHIFRIYLDHFVRNDQPRPNGARFPMGGAEVSVPLSP